MSKRNRQRLAMELMDGTVVVVNVGDEVLITDQIHLTKLPKRLKGKWMTIVGITTRGSVVVKSSVEGDWNRVLNTSHCVVEVNRVLREEDKFDVLNY